MLEATLGVLFFSGIVLLLTLFVLGARRFTGAAVVSVR